MEKPSVSRQRTTRAVLDLRADPDPQSDPGERRPGAARTASPDLDAPVLDAPSLDAPGLDAPGLDAPGLLALLHLSRDLNATVTTEQVRAAVDAWAGERLGTRSVRWRTGGRPGAGAVTERLPRPTDPSPGPAVVELTVNLDGRHRTETSAATRIGADADAGTAPESARAAHGDAPLGTLTLTWPPGSSEPTHPAVRALLQPLATEVGPAFERALMFEREREVARALRSAVLPDDLPQPEGWWLSGAYVAAAGFPAVGGDWHDAFPLPGGRIALVVGDAAGHGLEAARVMGALRNAVRAYAVLGEGPARLVERLDEMLAALDDEAFATMVYLEIDPEDGSVVWSCAGHPPPLLVRAPAELDAEGKGRPHADFARLDTCPADPPLGVPLPAPRRTGSFRIDPGDAVLLYTDGLVERRDQAIDVGLERLRQAVSQTREAPGRSPHEGELPGTSRSRLAALLRALLGAQGPADDVCVLAVGRRLA